MHSRLGFRAERSAGAMQSRERPFEVNASPIKLRCVDRRQLHDADADSRTFMQQLDAQ